MNTSRCKTVLLLDCDGTSVDSERAVEKARRSVAQNKGYQIDEAEFSKCIGRTSAHNVAYFTELLSLSSKETTEFRDEVANILWQQAKAGAIALQPGLINLLSLTEQLNVKCAFVSNSSEQWVKTVLAPVINEYPDLKLISIERVGVDRGKPYPDIYEAACKDLECSPADCLVVEDTAVGVEAAEGAGIETIFITHSFAEPPASCNPTWVISSLLEVVPLLKENSVPRFSRSL